MGYDVMTQWSFWGHFMDGQITLGLGRKWWIMNVSV